MQNTVKACLSIFRIRLAESLQYRIAALSGASISVFYALIEIVVLTVFYTHASGSASSMGGLTLGQVVSYTWIAQILFPIAGMGIDGEIHRHITSGDVGVELCRPMDLYGHWFAKTAAGRLGGMWLRSSLVVLTGALLPGAMGLDGPASLAGLCMFLLTAVGAFALCTSYAMLVTAIRLNVSWGEGPTHMIMLVSSVLSGAYLPLQLWPDALQRVLLLQPFSGSIDIPARLYVGSMTPLDGLGGLALQLFWTCVFIAAGRLVMRRKLRTLIVQGG